MGRQHSPTDDLRDLRAAFSADSALSTPERSVLAVLLLHRNGDTGRTDPSVPAIAAESGLGRRTVVRVLAELEARGWLTRQQRHGCRTRYSVTVPTSATVALVPERHQCHSGTGLVPERHQTSATAAPERTKERTKERADVVAPLWTAYLEEFGRDRLTLTDGRRKKLAALHAEQLVQEPDPVVAFRRILQAVKASPHHMGNLDYQLPESLFRSPERRESWAEKGRNNGSQPRDPLLFSTEELRKAG